MPNITEAQLEADQALCDAQEGIADGGLVVDSDNKYTVSGAYINRACSTFPAYIAEVRRLRRILKAIASTPIDQEVPKNLQRKFRNIARDALTEPTEHKP